MLVLYLILSYTDILVHYSIFSTCGPILFSSNLHLSPSYLTSISPVFTDEWFGAVDENNHIMNSRCDSLLFLDKDSLR